VVGAILPFTPLARVLGFTPLPPVFFAILLGMIVTYLGLVEVTKAAFYRAHPHPLASGPRTHVQRLEHRLLRRVGHFTRHTAAVRPR
jgi:Mg2+-importing ATPase